MSVSFRAKGYALLVKVRPGYCAFGGTSNAQMVASYTPAIYVCSRSLRYQCRLTVAEKSEWDTLLFYQLKRLHPPPKVRLQNKLVIDPVAVPLLAVQALLLDIIFDLQEDLIDLAA